MLFFLDHGFRVVAHHRHGHGRSSQGADGHDMNQTWRPSPRISYLRDVIHEGSKSEKAEARTAAVQAASP